jgi:hypothetical protein
MCGKHTIKPGTYLAVILFYPLKAFCNIAYGFATDH